MSKNEKDYSAYISAISFEASTYAFFGGFVFTAITIILTLLPDPSTWQSQATLFFLTLLFHMLLTMLIGHNLLIA